MVSNFKALVKDKRSKNFPSTFEIVYAAFVELGLDKKPQSYFLSSASDVVERLREYNWELFLKYEKAFTVEVCKELIRPDVESLGSRAAIEDFVEENAQNLYDLALSNTQSRRSRAGSEFEAIISFLFMGADIPFDEQGKVGTGLFADGRLAKLVDHVVPGAVEYAINKRSTLLMSAKTTLRERWQQIGDEMQRTRMPEMYLATLDERISPNTLEQLNNNNIYPVTTQGIKERCYKDSALVLTFEELLAICKSKHDTWKKEDYSEETCALKVDILESAITQSRDKPFVRSYLERRLAFYR